MKKTFKRLGVALLAMAMAVSVLCTGALADDANSITIKTTSSGHNYEAYQVFTGTLATVNGNKVLSNIQWGTGVNNAEDALLTAVKAINLGTDEAKNEPFAQCTDAASVAKVLSGKENDSDIVKAFAKVVAKHLSNTDTDFTENKTTNTDQDGNQTTTTTGYTASNLNAGYYLVKDADNSTGIDAFTDYILQVIGATDVEPKSGVPTVDKTVNGKSADTANIGDEVEFKLFATLPNNYEDYSSYKLVFNDTLSNGLTLTDEQLNSLTVKVYESKEAATADTENEQGTELKKLGTDATTDDKTGYKVEKDTNNNRKFTVSFEDLMQAKTTIDGAPTIKNGYCVVVTYKANLNENAVLGGTGNLNTVNLTYSNDPNGTSDGTTTDKKVPVYTFQMNVVKKDGTGENAKALAGAKFVLATDKLTKTENEATTDVNVITSDDIETYKENLVAVTAGDKPLYAVGGTNYEMEVSGDEGTKGQLNIKGLKDGVYYLYETKAPNGYNKLTEPIKITITASKDNDVPNGKVSATLTNAATGSIAEVDSGILDKVTVVNNAGSQLPSTGGMGTTLFYIIGGVLMAGAAVVLVIKKKRSSAE